MTHNPLLSAQLIKNKECNATLNFKPISHWPSVLPGVSVNKVLVAGFDQELIFNHQVENPKFSEKFFDLFFSIHTDLSWIEWVRFKKLLESFTTTNSDLSFNLNLFFERSFFKTNDYNDSIAELAIKLPKEFQSWAAQKKITAGELTPLLSASKLDLTELYSQIHKMNLSRAQGVSAIELVVELLLLGHSKVELQLHSNLDKNKSELWLNQLKKLRYPETFQKDNKAQLAISNLPWPASSQVKWVRHGDKAGIELKFFISAPHELKRASESLDKVQTALTSENDELEQLWNRH